jgi:flagellar hook-length control protein FliK
MAFASVHQKGESPFSEQALSVDLQAVERFTTLLEEGHALTKEALNVCERRLAQSEFPHQAFEPLLQASTHGMAPSVEQVPTPEQKSGMAEVPSQLLTTVPFEQTPVTCSEQGVLTEELPTRVSQVTPNVAALPNSLTPAVVKPASVPETTPSQSLSQVVKTQEVVTSQRTEVLLPEAVAPQVEVVTPHTEVASPQVEVAMPHTEVVTPRTEVASPQVEPVTPRTAVVTPQVEPAMPRTEAVTPTLQYRIVETEGVEQGSVPAVAPNVLSASLFPTNHPLSLDVAQPVDQPIVGELPQGITSHPMVNHPDVSTNGGAPTGGVQQTPVLTQEAVTLVGERPLVADRMIDVKGREVRDTDGMMREPLQVIAPTMLPITMPHQQVETVAQPIASHEIAQHFLMAAQTVADAMLVSSGFVRGEGQLLVRLRPEVLGGSEIRLVATEGTLTVIVHPATQDVQALVEANRTQFEQYLAEKVTSWRLAVTVKRGGNDDERL